MENKNVKEIILNYTVEGRSKDTDEQIGFSFESEIHEKVKAVFSKKTIDKDMPELIDLATNPSDEDIEEFKQMFLEEYYNSDLNYNETSDMAIKLDFEIVYE